METEQTEQKKGGEKELHNKQILNEMKFNQRKFGLVLLLGCLFALRYRAPMKAWGWANNKTASDGASGRKFAA